LIYRFWTYLKVFATFFSLILTKSIMRTKIFMVLYLRVEKFEFDVRIRSSSNVHFLEFSSLKYSHCIEMVNRFSTFKFDVCLNQSAFQMMGHIWAKDKDRQDIGCFHHLQVPDLSTLQLDQQDQQNSRVTGIHLRQFNNKTLFKLLDEK